MDPDPDEDETEDVRLVNKRERHWRIVLDYNDGGTENDKALIHDNMWYLYMNDKEVSIMGSYYVEVSGSDGN